MHQKNLKIFEYLNLELWNYKVTSSSIELSLSNLYPMGYCWNFHPCIWLFLDMSWIPKWSQITWSRFSQNFQLLRTSILQAIDKTLSPGLLKNSQNREAKTEYLNHLNHCFNLGVEYQSSSKHPKLQAYKISTSLDVYSRIYGLNTETLFRKPEV